MPHRLPPVVTALLDAADAPAREAAWSDFLAEYNKLVFYVCHSYGGDYDVVMDRYAFVVEQLRRDDGRRLRGFDTAGSGKFTTWLTVVLRRLCLDEHRKRYGRRQSAGDDAEQQELVRRDLVDLVAASLDTVQAPDAGALPDDVAADGERRAHLAAALDTLSPEDRLILRYRFEQELSVPEIARLTGAQSPFHLYRQIDRLLAALRVQLGRSGISNATM
jgi:RNA polymerase sigma factor (sigma-70 family)